MIMKSRYRIKVYLILILGCFIVSYLYMTSVATSQPGEWSMRRERHIKGTNSRYCITVANMNTCDSLPNYFIHRYEVKRQTYRESVVTFVHVPKCGGTTLKNCLVKVAKEEFKQTPYLLFGRNRFEIELTPMSVNCPYSIFMGSDSLGICNKVVAKPCSYFMILREPYERMVSLYFECRAKSIELGHDDDDCIMLPITKWAAGVQHHFLFFQLHRRVYCPDNRVDSCEFITPLEVFEQSKNVSYIKHITNSLSEIFAVIGLAEDMSTTYKLLEHVYNLHFDDICSSMWMNKGKYEIENEGEVELIKERYKKELMNDDSVRKLMYPELMLYEKAKEIFEIEKQILPG